MSQQQQDNASLIELLGRLPESEKIDYYSSLTEEEATALEYDWRVNARQNQLLPSGAWVLWLILAGRGFGKTRTGAETVRQWVEQGYQRIHLVGATASDARDVMVQGESGLLSVFPPHQRPLYEPSKRMITFHTGAVAVTFSAEEPERLRGPQCEAFWCDELAAWSFLQDAWDNLMFGFRLGSDPRGIITTTPKPLKLLKDIIADSNTIVTRGSSYENRSNLAPAFFQAIVKKYEGTRIGRQELLAEILEDVPGALWTRQLIEAGRKPGYPAPLARIVVAVDPAVSRGENSSETGIIVVGLDWGGHVYVLQDLSMKGSPGEWGRVVVSALASWRGDMIVGEVNNGGDLVESNVRAINPNIPFRQVRASRGKLVRAEPVANLYEQGRVHHVGAGFVQLEDQMCSYVPNSDLDSPDHMDALVWGITELLIDIEQTESYKPIVQRVQISRF